ncbi:hypothetical protein CR513_41204, partial [Mucuna pruriens]
MSFFMEIRKRKSTWRFSKDYIFIMKITRYAYLRRHCKYSNSLPEHEYRQSQGDYTLIIKHSCNSKLTLLLVYVDDMIIASDNEIEKLTLKEKMTTQFEMKRLSIPNKVSLSAKKKYLLDLLKEIGKLACKTSKAPIE